VILCKHTAITVWLGSLLTYFDLAKVRAVYKLLCGLLF